MFIFWTFFCFSFAGETENTHGCYIWSVYFSWWAKGSHKKAAIDCEWNQKWLFPFVSVFSLSTAFMSLSHRSPWSKHFLPLIRLTFYLHWDGQPGAYQHGQWHLPPHPQQRSHKQTSWKLCDPEWIRESTYILFSPKQFAPKSLCVCSLI